MNSYKSTILVMFLLTAVVHGSACTWEESDAGVDLAPSQWDGSGQTSFEQCKLNADAAGVSYFAWTGRVYNGYCKVLKSSVTSPNLNTNQGYGYKLWQKCPDNGYQWVVQDNTNCYPSINGADEHSCCPRSDYTIQTFESCQQLCIDTVGCDGITISDSAPRRCYLRHNLVLNNCVSNSAGWTSAKVSESVKSWSCAVNGRSPGTSLGRVFVSSMDECKASCESLKGCKAIGFRKSTGSCYRLDRFYDSKYEKKSDNDAYSANYGIDQRCDVFTATAEPGKCLKTEISDIGMVLRNHPHTIQVQLSFPNYVPTVREWILNLGQRKAGSHHWIWPSGGNSQIGKWNGKQITHDISACTYLTTTFSGSVLKLFCDGTYVARKNVDFDINSPQLTIGTKPVVRGNDFGGCISEVSIIPWEKTKEEIAQQSLPAFTENCRWQTAQDPNIASHLVTDTYMGWTCRDNEILTGFGLTANDNDITKVQCCSLGGHSSVKPNTCSFIEVDGIEAGKAFCGDNQDHKVFSGAYDKRIRPGAVDAYTEILAGKCCEVECDAGWCANGDWGVDKTDCTIVSAQDNVAQELVCPTGTLMTEIHDAQNGLAHGVQKVGSVKCCALHTVAAPTVKPTFAPSRTPSHVPTVAPTKAPTTVKHCLLENRDNASGDVAYLEGLARCLPGCDQVPEARRALEGRLLNEGEFY